MTSPSADDPLLLASLRKGDEEAFSALINRYHGPLLRLAMSFVPGLAVAEEVVQETWMGVLEGIDRFEGRSSLKTWIFRILVNRARTRGVREHRTIPFSALNDTGNPGDDPAVAPDRFLAKGAMAGHWAVPPHPWDEGTPERLLLSKEGREAIDAAIGELPPHQQQVIVLRDVEGVPSDEVCNILGVSETNQRVLLHRARAKVRKSLERYLEGEVPQR